MRSIDWLRTRNSHIGEQRLFINLRSNSYVEFVTEKKLSFPASRVSFDLPRQIGKRKATVSFLFPICLGRSKETLLAG